MDLNSFTFDSIHADGDHAPNFEAGEMYNALIVALVGCDNTYQGVTKSGFMPVFAVEDGDGVQCYKAGDFINLQGFPLSSKSKLCKLYQALLKTNEEGSQLLERIKKANLNNLKNLVGHPCVVTISMKQTAKGNSFPVINNILGITSRMRGLDHVNIEGDLDVNRVVSKFVQVQPENIICMEGVVTRVSTQETAKAENEDIPF